MPCYLVKPLNTDWLASVISDRHQKGFAGSESRYGTCLGVAGLALRCSARGTLLSVHFSIIIFHLAESLLHFVKLMCDGFTVPMYFSSVLTNFQSARALPSDIMPSIPL